MVRVGRVGRFVPSLERLGMHAALAHKSHASRENPIQNLNTTSSRIWDLPDSKAPRGIFWIRVRP